MTSKTQKLYKSYNYIQLAETGNKPEVDDIWFSTNFISASNKMIKNHRLPSIFQTLYQTQMIFSLIFL